MTLSQILAIIYIYLTKCIIMYQAIIRFTGGMSDDGVISAPEGSFITEDGSLVAADGTYLMTIARSAYILLKGLFLLYI